MLKALSKGKAKNYEKGSLSDYVKTCEDSLTAGVWGRLFYLPRDVMYKILNESIDTRSDKIPESLKVLSQYEFWPSWYVYNNENNKNDNKAPVGSRVEPDLFISTPELPIIVEAKRYDYTTQYESQWNREIEALLSMDSCSKFTHIHFIACGGVEKFSDVEKTINSVKNNHDNKTITISILSWKNLLHTITKEIKTFYLDSNFSTTPQTNILLDILEIFKMHGFYSSVFFNTLHSKKNFKINFANSLKSLQLIGETYDKLK